MPEPVPERPPNPEPPPANPVTAARLAALLFFLAWALNVYFYSGFYMSDDGSYLSGIQQLATLQPISPDNLAQTRLMTIVPAALVYAATGSLPVTILSYTLYHPLLVLVVYWVGTLAFTTRSALLAAALVALSPVYYSFGGAILPDNALCLWLGLLLAGLLWGLRWSGDPSRSERRELLLWLAIGGLNGMAYSAKEPGLIFVVPVALSILIGRLVQGARWRALRSVLAFGTGLLAFLLLEAVVLRAQTGVWFIRLMAGMGNDHNVGALLDRVKKQGVLPGQRLAFWYSRNAGYFGLALWGTVAAHLASLWLTRPRGWLAQYRGRLAILASFWLWPFLYLTLGTASLRQYLPPPLQHARYFSVCAAPSLLFMAVVLSELFEHAAGRLPEARPRLQQLLRAVPAALGLIWGVAMFLQFEPGAGAIYRSLETKAALAAFQDARRLYPKLSVVLSSYLGARLDPLLHTPGCSACDRIIAQVDTLPEAPPRPFVAIMLSQSNRDSLGPALARLQKSHEIELQPIGLGVYRAPVGRRTELRAALYPLLGEFSEPSGPRAERDEALSLYLVSDSAAR
jgi:4-amino-4-deoxy-L-arabinose transferase-like glycosyltransferase